MKSYHERKTFCEIFATFKFVIVLLAAQVNRKVESDIEFSGHGGVFTLETVKHLCQMMVRYRVFNFVSFLFLSSVLKFERNVRIQHKDHNRPTLELTIVSAKSKIYSPRRGYLSPGNSIVLGIAATLLFISVTIFCLFWGSFC